MFPCSLPLLPPFITSALLRPLPEQPDVLLLDARFDAAHFSESLFATLGIGAPQRLQRAVTKRRAEYLASRYCLQQAMRALGIENFILHNDAGRAPLWPDGIRGSLSHTHHRICALLTRRADLLPGIDCEQIMTADTAREMAKMIAGAGEIALLAQSAHSFPAGLTVLFSAKESLYKAVWPRLRQFLDFSAAEVVDLQAQQLTLRLTATFSAEFYAGREFIARVKRQPDTVLTWIVGLEQGSTRFT